jgi:hypothetical protein
MGKKKKQTVVREIDPSSQEWTALAERVKTVLKGIQEAWRLMFPDDTEDFVFDQYINTFESFLSETEEYDIYAVLNEERIEELKLIFDLPNQIQEDNGKMINITEGIRSCLADIKDRRKNGPFTGEYDAYHAGLKTLYINLLEDSVKIAKRIRFITEK